MNVDEPETQTVSLPAGDYALIELFGHQQIVGRIAEIDRFGTKFLQIEPVFDNKLLDPVLQGGGSIYRLTPCSAETAARAQPKQSWQLPDSVKRAAGLGEPARIERFTGEDFDEGPYGADEDFLP